MVISITKATPKRAPRSWSAPSQARLTAKVCWEIVTLSTSHISSAGSYCVYCPSDPTLPCVPVSGYTQANCTEGIACEFADGSVEFGLTEGECR